MAEPSENRPRKVQGPPAPRKKRQAATKIDPTGGASIWGQMAAGNVGALPFRTSAVTANPQADVLAWQRRAGNPNQLRQNLGGVSAPSAAGGSGGGSRGGGGSNGGSPPAGEGWTGFAGRYVPGQQDLIWDNPEIILRDFLGQNGRKDNLALEGDMQRYADIALPLYTLLMGGDMDPKTNESDTIINWIANNYLSNLSTPGGKTPQVGDMLEQLIAGFSDPDSILGQSLYTPNPTTGGQVAKGTNEQIKAIMAYLPLLGEFSNPIYANAIRNQANRIASDFRQDQANGKAGGKDFLDYLKRSFLGGQ